MTPEEQTELIKQLRTELGSIEYQVSNEVRHIIFNINPI